MSHIIDVKMRDSKFKRYDTNKMADLTRSCSAT